MKRNKIFKLPYEPEEELRHLSSSITSKERCLENFLLSKKEKKKLEREIAEAKTKTKQIEDALKKGNR